jgi:hypothetical protein
MTKITENTRLLNKKYERVDNIRMYKTSDLYKLEGKDGADSTIHWMVKFHQGATARTCNHKGKQHTYIVANDAMDKWVREQNMFQMIKGVIRKPIQSHYKNCQVIDKKETWGQLYKVNLDMIDCFILAKWN